MAEAKWSGVLSTTEPRNDVGIIKVRQGNINSEIAEFQIVQNNKPYDLTGLTVYFCASFGLNLVEKPAVVVNTTGGRIQYTFDDDSMQSVGRQKGYFSIKKEESMIDSTQDFEFQVDSSLMSRSIDGKSYIYKLSTLIKILDDFIKNGQYDFNTWFESVKEILYGVDPGGNILRELIEARTTETGQTFDTLKARLNTFDAQFAHTVSGGNIVSLAAYKRNVPENNDLGRFQRAIDEAPEGSVLSLSDELFYEIPSTVLITKKLHLLANGTELRAVTEGMTDLLQFTKVDGLIISGVKFNGNLVGRTSLKLVECTNFLIDKCSFTGYSKEFAYYQTDSGIILENCQNGKILFSDWKDHGFQYSSATADLNRCISIQGYESDNVTVIGCSFDKVNQGIVISSGSHIFLANTFKNVKDNVLYLVGSKSVVFSGNIVDQKFDECVVISSGKLIMTGNDLKNVPNKFIAINGDVDSIISSNNSYDNREITEMAQFFAWRDPAHTVKSFSSNNDTFLNNGNIHDYEYFSIGNVDNFEFEGAKVDVGTVAYQKMILFKGTKAKGKIKNSKFTGRTYQSEVVGFSASVVNPDIVYEDNDMTQCRVPISGLTLKGRGVVAFNTSIPYLTGENKNNVFYADTAPTAGKWNVNDLVLSYKSNKSAGDPIGWVCTAAGTPGTWLPFGEIDLKKTFGILPNWLTTNSLDFGGSWVNKPSQELQYYKNAQGIVSIRGTVQNGTQTVGQRIYTLPPLYSPLKETIVQAESNGVIVFLKIEPTGAISIYSGVVGNQIRIISETQGFRTT